MNRFKAALKYIHYYKCSKSKYALHPPFAYKLLTEVMLDKRPCKEYVVPEIIRKEMLKNNISIEVTDLGAGSKGVSKKIRKIKNIAKYSSESPKYAQLIFRLAKHFQPPAIIEIGTSLGITTAYIANAIPNGKVFTIEGCGNIASVAEQNFMNHSLTNIKLVNSNFDEALPQILLDLNKAPFVFFDGNHRKEPTLKYFDLCLHYADYDSVFIFDDIHWSKEMEEAWKCIKQSTKVTLTIDLHFLGIVFFRRELSKQDFVLRF